MNPIIILPTLAYALVAVLWPAQIDGHRRGATVLAVESFAGMTMPMMTTATDTPTESLRSHA